MKVTVRICGLVTIGALLWTCLPAATGIDAGCCLASSGSSSQEDAEAIREALQRMNALIREGTRRYEAGEIGLIELWEMYMRKAMELKYQAMAEAFPDVFGYPFVQLYNHLEWIDKNLEIFQELASRASEDPDTTLDPTSFSEVISELEREKGKLEGVIERYIVDLKRAQATSATDGRIALELPAGQPLSCEDIDGVISFDETCRDNALVAVTELVPGNLHTTVWVMSDDTSVYISFEVLLPSSLPADRLAEAYLSFDVSQDGQHFTRGDDLKVLNLVAGEATDYFYLDDYAFRRDVDFGGQHDVCAASTFSPLDSGETKLEIEFLIDRNSGDQDGADPVLTTARPISVMVGLIGELEELRCRDELVVTVVD